MSKNDYLCNPKTVEPLIGRVVYRGNNNANANGGVSYANANNDASNSNANLGSRLNYNRNKNRRTTKGTCSRRGAEGGEPQQQRHIAGKLKNHVSG